MAYLPPYDPVQLGLARRKGALAFGFVSIMQALAVVVTTLVLLPVIYLAFVHGQARDLGFLPFCGGVKWGHLSIGFAGGAVPLMLLSVWIGRWAGPHILLKGASASFTGIVAMQVAGFFATLLGVWISSIDLLGNPFFETSQPPRMLREAMVYVPVAFYLPTFLTGLLGGVLTRRWGRAASSPCLR